MGTEINGKSRCNVNNAASKTQDNLDRTCPCELLTLGYFSMCDVVRAHCLCLSPFRGVVNRVRFRRFP